MNDYAWRGGLGTASPYAGQVESLATQYGVPPSVALAVMQAESSGDPNAVSKAGAQGLFQLMPATAASLGVSNPFDPTQNITGGLTYLHQLYQQFGDWNLALEAYNEGPGALQAQLSAGTVPVSAGYASGILAAAGPLDGSDLSDTGSQTASTDIFDSLDGSMLTSMSGMSIALVAVLLIGGLLLFGRQT